MFPHSLQIDLIRLNFESRSDGMRRHITFSLVAAACLLAGCNQPAVTLKPPAFQASENTVRDWNDVALKIAAEVAARGLLPAPWQPVPPNMPTVKPIFVRIQAPDSAFVSEVANELEAEILRRGGIVARGPANATVVNLDVNFVRWGPRDKPPGLLGTTLGIAAIPGIVIGASVPMSTWTAADAAAFTALGGGLFLDGLIALTPTMNAEAIWKATIIADDRVVMEIQEPVYVRAPDIPLYAKATSLSPSVSWSDNTPLRTRLIRYDP
jgi:hypothetical protein